MALKRRQRLRHHGLLALAPELPEGFVLVAVVADLMAAPVGTSTSNAGATLD
ncbi:hypothetical protein [Verminephrobacter eiseniae]|uniref:hypothetical protein n=1 Tax=Verminephrobacter eiseniae TaxID=364317 RepID=UPI0022374DF5|nr:hypothetical protein [Verminephrobacter eiseniae]